MLRKHLEIKKRHHYVWAKYLMRWGNNTKNVFYTTKTGKFAHDSVRAILVDDYFYKITKLSNKDIKVIKGFSRLSPDHLQQLHMSYLSDFLKLQKVESIYLESSVRDQYIEQTLHSMKCNLLENLHVSHEKSALSILDALADEKLDVLQESQKMIDFMSFIGHQIARTKTFRDSTFESQPRSNGMEIEVANTVEHAWWFLSYMYGMNLGASLFLDRNNSRHALLVNDTKVPFITSDHPVVNVHSCISEGSKVPPKYADLYYPISPRIAYIICDSDRFTSGRSEIDDVTAVELNTKIAAQAKVHIIGDTEAAIRPFKQYIGRRHR